VAENSGSSIFEFQTLDIVTQALRACLQLPRSLGFVCFCFEAAIVFGFVLQASGCCS